jgi:hypothetical protein
MRGRLALLVGTVAIGLGVLAPPAVGDHHVVQIREVFPGTTAAPGTEFVELQLYSGGQNNFAPASRLEFLDGTGAEVDEVPVADVTNGGSQRTALIGTPGVTTLFGPTPDTGYATGIMSPDGGAVRFISTNFGTIDCVAWGTITGAPACAGTPAGAIPDGSSLERSIAAGCSTLLEFVDDTDDSAADFAPLASPTPRANATTPTEGPCLGPPQTTITKAPKPNGTDRTPKIKFVAQPAAGATFECTLDGDPLGPCQSPLTTPRLSLGRHQFKVAAEGPGGLDPTPAKARFRIVKR